MILSSRVNLHKGIEYISTMNHGIRRFPEEISKFKTNNN
jgi:hypothetical protein